MMAELYPRDLIGYGRTPPDPHWPGGARVAVQFVINYEEGGESCILHVSSLLTTRPEVQAGAWVYDSWGPRFIPIDQMSTIGQKHGRR
jgi:hypothetical protein